MGRGRKRKFNPDIPAHIDQAALPKGIYWEDNRWYLLEAHPEGGRPRKRTVAHADIRLSELHSIAEAAEGNEVRGVIPPPISRRQKWNFLVPFPEEVP